MHICFLSTGHALISGVCCRWQEELSRREQMETMLESLQAVSSHTHTIKTVLNEYPRYRCFVTININKQ